MGVKIENELIIMALWLGQVEFNNMLLKKRVKNILETLDVENGNFQDFEVINNRLDDIDSATETINIILQKISSDNLSNIYLCIPN